MITLGQAFKTQESLNAVPYPILLRCLWPLHTWGCNAHCWNGGCDWEPFLLRILDVTCPLCPWGNGVLWRIVFLCSICCLEMSSIPWNVIHSQKYFQLNVILGGLVILKVHPFQDYYFQLKVNLCASLLSFEISSIPKTIFQPLMVLDLWVKLG